MMRDLRYVAGGRENAAMLRINHRTGSPKPAVIRMMDTDRDFFLANPHREYRLRRVMPGDVPVGAVIGQGFYFVVRQIVPSVRLRMSAEFPTGEIPDDTDATGRRLWRLGAVVEPRFAEWRILVLRRELKRIMPPGGWL